MLGAVCHLTLNAAGLGAKTWQLLRPQSFFTQNLLANTPRPLPTLALAETPDDLSLTICSGMKQRTHAALAVCLLTASLALTGAFKEHDFKVCCLGVPAT